MKVIHLPIEIAGQMGMYCRAIKKFGHQAIGYNYFHTVLKYKDDILPVDGYEITNILEDAIQHFDIFHYHYMLTTFTDFSDLEMVAAAGKPMIMNHWGSDVRKARIAKMNNPYVNMEGFPTEEEIHENLLKVSKYISTAIVQDYEVLPYVTPYYKKVHVLPVTVDVSKFEPVYPRLDESYPLVVHAPTQPKYKGTEIIEQVIKELQQIIPFRYQRIEKMNHEQAKNIYKQADIIIDQILFGSYGVLSVESMALGKPVISYVRDDLLGYYKDLPICTANPDTIQQVLKQLLLSPDLRNKKGQDGRKYVEKYHDINVVGLQLLEIYEQLLKSNKVQNTL
ncbi:glycosyltransferase [Heyndrickxia oleronia]|uniref:glycosyltransferase n=1 Tax=Heyndrickxia oleronia TaxID=38875 RepID=UPI00203AA80B|nr:glycosyltransferase [Heyndrickxia oleronia]MCM3238006.1 glycosyltransferase [Heyndrickxia oleronia]